MVIAYWSNSCRRYNSCDKICHKRDYERGEKMTKLFYNISVANMLRLVRVSLTDGRQAEMIA